MSRQEHVDNFQMNQQTSPNQIIYRKNKRSAKYFYLIKAGVEKKLLIATWNVYYPDCPTLKECPTKITLHSFWIKAAMILFIQKVSNTKKSIKAGRGEEVEV